MSNGRQTQGYAGTGNRWYGSNPADVLAGLLYDCSDAVMPDDYPLCIEEEDNERDARKRKRKNVPRHPGGLVRTG